MKNLFDLTTQVSWESAANYKKNLFAGQTIEQPLQIRKEVLDSWLRCRDFGLSPESRPCCPVTDEELSPNKKLLLRIVSDLLENFQYLADFSNYTISLIDENSILLLQTGYKAECDKFEKMGIKHGHLVDEQHIGTSAHVLALLHRCPIQLVGPENLYDAFAKNISSSAPLFDEDNNMLGVLTFILRESRYPFSEEVRIFRANALGWVIFMAQSISEQYKLEMMSARLYSTNQMLEATFAYLDEGIVTIDPNGCITSLNARAQEIFADYNYTFKNTNICNFFKSDSEMIRMVLTGTRLDYAEDILVTDKGERSFLFSSRPLFDETKTKFAGAVIRITSKKKLQNYVSSQGRLGAQFHFDDIVGESAAIVSAKKLAVIFAKTPENILLTGESGTGKELFAQSIHNLDRPNGPFVAINCAALPLNLVESELFGYEGGSFTGAERKGRPGKIELANNGTLFLDEIGDMALDMQAVLLRVLEDKCVMRIGGSSYTRVNFRLVAATNQDLYRMVENKQFRADLYYRLSALNVILPPLRQRDEDVVLLAEFFIQNYCRRVGRPALAISDTAKNCLCAYPWPGNVRQLEKAMVYAVSVTQAAEITVNDLPDTIVYYQPCQKTILSTTDDETGATGDILTLQEMEFRLIRRTMRAAGNNISKAASMLNIGKSTLYAKIKQYEIEN